MSPGFRPCHDYHDASPYGQACARYSIVHFHQNLLVQSCPLNPWGNTEDKRKEGQRVFALGLSVTLFPFLLWFGLSQLFRRLGRSCFLPGSHTEHAQDGVKNRVVPSLVVNCCFGRGPDLSVPVSWMGYRRVWVRSKASPLPDRSTQWNLRAGGQSFRHSDCIGVTSVR